MSTRSARLLAAVVTAPRFAGRADMIRAAAHCDFALARLEARAAGLPDTTPSARLAEHIRAHGPVPAVRVSSAKARGKAKQYAYWGAVRYELRLGSDGAVHACAMERASSDRRSERLAALDAEEIAARDDRFTTCTIGRLHESECSRVLAWLGADAERVAL